MAQLLDSNEIFFTPFEPKVANRFIMFIEGIPAYLVRKASRPTAVLAFELAANNALKPTAVLLAADIAPFNGLDYHTNQ